MTKRRQQTAPPRLSKTRFLSGLQCLKRLYLECFQPELATPAIETEQAVLDVGKKVEEFARKRFSGGVLIDDSQFDVSAAAEETEKMLSQGQIKALFQGAFVHEDVVVRTDILERVTGNRFDLIEVKSGSSVKEVHEPDVAVQLHVLRGAGLDIRKVFLLHLNTGYVYQGGDYNLEELFTLEDLTEIAEGWQEDVFQGLSEMRKCLSAEEVPDIPIGDQCSSPHPCPFYGHCNQNPLEHPISELPRARQELLDRLEEAGIEEIKEIPQGFPGLSPLQERVRDVVASGKPFFDPQIRKELQKAIHPIHFVDFETFNPALPLFQGTHPYSVIPFQWSDHIMAEDRRVEHYEFLHDSTNDPRPAFIESLLNVLGDKGSIVVYSPYEATILKALARDFPRHERGLLLLLDRILDLLPLVRNNVYHPDFHGSFSIKAVLPALCGTSYGGLEITDGMQAAVCYAEMIGSETEQARRDEIRKSLAEYCARDTEAMRLLLGRLSGADSL